MRHAAPDARVEPSLRFRRRRPRSRSSIEMGLRALLVVAALTGILTGCTRQAFEPGARVLLDAHNAYPYHGQWRDRIDRALATGVPVAIEQDLAWRDGDVIRFRAGMMDELRRRELRQVAGQLSKEMGLEYIEHRGGSVEGTYREAVQVGSAKYAVIEKSREFTLLPWRPVLEKQVGRHVSGIGRGDSISWSFGRQRAGPEIG